MRPLLLTCKLLFCCLLLHAQWQAENFVTITTENGLPDNGINHIFQDHTGFIWFATNAGLTKYDGREYITYKPQGLNQHNYGANRITHIIENPDGNLWIGSNRGVYRFDPDRVIFENFYFDFLGLNASYAVPVLEDITGKLWVIISEGNTAYKGKLIRLDPETGDWKFFEEFSNSIGQEGFEAISIFVELSFQDAALIEDEKGNIWIGGAEEAGLAVFDPKSESFTIHQHHPNKQNTIPHNTVTAFHIDKQGTLWVGTYRGFCRFDQALNGFAQIPFETMSDDPRQDVIFDIEEDSMGNLWLIKNNQLDYFETRAQKFSIIFQGNVREGASPVNIIWIGEGREKELFFSMNNGSRLAYLDIRLGGKSKLKEFQPINYKIDFSNSIVGGLVSKDGILWAANSHLGVLKENPFQRNFIHHDANEGGAYATSPLTHMVEDGLGRIWLGSKNGLKVLDPVMGKSWILDDFKGKDIESLLVDGYGYIWIGTRSSGLYKADVSVSNMFSRNLALNKPTKSSSVESLDYQGMYAVDGDESTRWATAFSDPQWLSIDLGQSFKIGLILLNWEYAAAKQYKIELSENGTTWRTIFTEKNGSSGVKSIKTSEKGRFLRISGSERTTPFGYSLHEVEVYEALPEFEQFVYDPADSSSLGGMHVNSIFEDTRKRIWVGTNNKTLGRFRPETNDWENERFESDRQEKTITSIQEDRFQRLWLKGWCCADPEPLIMFDPQTRNKRIYKSVLEDETSLSSDVIYALYGDSEGNIWVATRSNGINLYQFNDDTFKRIIPYTAFADNENVIHQDREGRIWAASFQEGLFQLDATKGVVKNFLKADGLASEKTYAVIDADDGAVWLSTEEGITMLNPESGRVLNFSTNDELISESYRNLSYRDRANNLYFSGDEGLTIVRGKSIFRDTISPNFLVSSLLVDGQLQYPKAENSILQKPIYATDMLSIGHNQNIVEFKFGALHFSNPSSNQYAVKLEGLDDEWKYIGNRNEEKYTGLAPGKYTFKLKAANPDGVWAEAKSIAVDIRYPWWRQWWAWLLYTAAFFWILDLARKNIVRQERVKGELRLKAMEAEKLQEIDKLKTRFFANISHEFRTPLTLMLGPVQQLREGAFEGDINQQYEKILRNGNKLLELINQLLDLSKLEARGLRLQAAQEDLVAYLKLTYASFNTLATSRTVRFELMADRENLKLYFDKEKLDKIIYNLLSNAFKFTPEGGTIKIDVRVVEEYNTQKLAGEWKLSSIPCARISIFDSGMGIPDSDLPHIFDRFYQADGSEIRMYKGTGIGLSLVKELVNLHYGNIEVESRLHQGTTFYLYLPLGKSHFKEDELIYKQTNFTDNLRKKISLPVQQSDTNRLLTGLKDPEDGSPLILIVEDNPEMQEYIADNLRSSFRLLSANDGVQGLEIAKEEIPDLIITDLMMPKMDGQELCKALKGNSLTSHIPVILLTAKAGEQARLEGLETGADDYIVKPFNAKELKVRVQNLIAQRKRLQELYGQNEQLKPKEISFTPADQTFLRNAIEFIETHITDESLGVESLSRALEMNHQQVYRKIKALTNQTPSGFIRTIRLKRAAQLLRHAHVNVSEVMYEVGFSNHSYFSKRFKEEFELSPSEYHTKHAQ